MVYRKQTFIRLAALFLTATAAPPLTHELLTHTASAQSFGDNPNSFPIPSALPEGTTLSVDGSTSMQVTNQVLESRFEEQFPNVDVTLNASRTDEAIAALLAGEIDLAASGRPLTAAEKAQGLVEVPLDREKLAIILGADNPFTGNLSFEQFAQIFRGEITNWSAVGGPDLPIRLVDRPPYSDTRRALSTYEVFRGQPFETGDTATPIDTDETDAVIEALGNDGIGYAVFSQVQDVPGIRILSMHETLPDDPRYPYSQYRAFVYREGAAPAALAFLGFATSEPGQEIITDDAVSADNTTAAATDTAREAGAAGEAGATADDASAIGTDTADATSESNATDSADSADAEAETALVPDAAPADDARGGFPWWLLGIPILGGLLWWLLKGLGGATPAAASAAQTAASAAQTAAPVPPPAGVAKAVAPRMVLTPRNCRDAYAYWEIPSDRVTEIKRQGGKHPQVRLYDVTERPPNEPLPAPTAVFDCEDSTPDLHLPVQQPDRDYLAEVGYLTADDRWLPAARSAPVRVSGNASGATDASFPGPTTKGITAGAAIGAAAVGAAAVGARQRLEDTVMSGPATSRIVLTPRNAKIAYAYWEVPAQAQTAVRAEGGQTYQLRICDVTDIDLDQQPPHSVLTYDLAETDRDRSVPLPAIDRHYLAEIGYRTANGGWLELARSQPMRPDEVLNQAAIRASATAALGLAAGGPAAGVAAGLAAPRPSAPLSTPPVQRQDCTIQTVTLKAQEHAAHISSDEMQHLQDAIATKHILDTGLYVLRLRDGVFNYDGDDTHPGEPFVLLWIYGGIVVNKKTGVPVEATWSTLNGYADTLTLEVREPAQVCAFFFDTFPEDNQGEVTLSILKL